ncbi:MAG: leucine-rich repeat protein [Acutalibacteraceae bacterium]
MKKISKLFQITLVSLFLILSLFVLAGAEMSADGYYSYETLPDGTAAFYGYYKDNSLHIEIPSEIEGKTLTKIFNIGAPNYESIESITIPETVSHIEPEAFCCLKSIKEITIPGSVKDTDYFLFCNNFALKKVTFSEGIEAFQLSVSSCYNLKYIVLPASLKTFKMGAIKIEAIIYNGTTEQWNEVAKSGYKITWDEILTIYKENYGTELKVHCTDHETQWIPAESPGCERDGYSAGTYCINCDCFVDGHESVPGWDHNYEITRYTIYSYEDVGEYANFKKYGGDEKTMDGIIANVCTNSNECLSSMGDFYTPVTHGTMVAPIYKIKSVDYQKEFIYDGKVKTPKVTITDVMGNKLQEGKDYTLTYPAGRKNVGRYEIKIKYAEDCRNQAHYGYSYFYILPAATTKITYTAGVNSIKLSWNKVTGAPEYKIYQAVDGKWKFLTKVYGQTTYTVTNLKAGTKYTFAVKAVDGGLISPKFTKITATTQPPAPNFTVKSNTKGTATITWNKSTGATGYTIYRYNTAKNKWTAIAVVTGKTTYKDTNLKSGTTVKYAVRPYIKLNGQTIYGKYYSHSCKIK